MEFETIENLSEEELIEIYDDIQFPDIRLACCNCSDGKSIGFAGYYICRKEGCRDWCRSHSTGTCVSWCHVFCWPVFYTCIDGITDSTEPL